MDLAVAGRRCLRGAHFDGRSSMYGVRLGLRRRSKEAVFEHSVAGIDSGIDFGAKGSDGGSTARSSGMHDAHGSIRSL